MKKKISQGLQMLLPVTMCQAYYVSHYSVIPPPLPTHPPTHTPTPTHMGDPQIDNTHIRVVIPRVSKIVSLIELSWVLRRL